MISDLVYVLLFLLVLAADEVLDTCVVLSNVSLFKSMLLCIIDRLLVLLLILLLLLYQLCQVLVIDSHELEVFVFEASLLYISKILLVFDFSDIKVGSNLLDYSKVRLVTLLL